MTTSSYAWLLFAARSIELGVLPLLLGSNGLEVLITSAGTAGIRLGLGNKKGLARARGISLTFILVFCFYTGALGHPLWLLRELTAGAAPLAFAMMASLSLFIWTLIVTFRGDGVDATPRTIDRRRFLVGGAVTRRMSPSELSFIREPGARCRHGRGRLARPEHCERALDLLNAAASPQTTPVFAVNVR
jgi:hypothetical protein